MFYSVVTNRRQPNPYIVGGEGKCRVPTPLSEKGFPRCKDGLGAYHCHMNALAVRTRLDKLVLFLYTRYIDCSRQSSNERSEDLGKKNPSRERVREVIFFPFADTKHTAEYVLHKRTKKVPL